jgi:hypothetical protein
LPTALLERFDSRSDFATELAAVQPIGLEHA